MTEGDVKNHVKNHPDEAVLEQVHSSGNAQGFYRSYRFKHQTQWEQPAHTGALRGFFSLLPPAGQTILNPPGISTEGELNLGMRRAGLGWAVPWPEPRSCSGALGHSQSSTVGHGAALDFQPQSHGLQLLSESVFKLTNIYKTFIPLVVLLTNSPGNAGRYFTLYKQKVNPKFSLMTAPSFPW